MCVCVCGVCVCVCVCVFVGVIVCVVWVSELMCIYVCWCVCVCVRCGVRACISATDPCVRVFTYISHTRTCDGVLRVVVDVIHVDTWTTLRRKFDLRQIVHIISAIPYTAVKPKPLERTQVY